MNEDGVSEEASNRGWKRSFAFNPDVVHGILLKKGFKTLYAMADYYWGIYNPKTFEIVTNTEGDIDTFKAKNEKDFIWEIEFLERWMRKTYPETAKEIQEEIKEMKKKKLKEVL